MDATCHRLARSSGFASRSARHGRRKKRPPAIAGAAIGRLLVNPLFTPRAGGVVASDEFLIVPVEPALLVVHCMAHRNGYGLPRREVIVNQKELELLGTVDDKKVHCRALLYLLLS